MTVNRFVMWYVKPCNVTDLFLQDYSEAPLGALTSASLQDLGRFSCFSSSEAHLTTFRSASLPVKKR